MQPLSMCSCIVQHRLAASLHTTSITSAKLCPMRLTSTLSPGIFVSEIGYSMHNMLMLALAKTAVQEESCTLESSQ